MARQETIKVIIDRTDANAELSVLKTKAEELKKEFGSIKVGDFSKSFKNSANAIKESESAMQKQINTLVGIGNAVKNAEKSFNVFARSEIADVKQIQAAYDKLSEAKRKEREKDAQEAMANFQARAKITQQEISDQEKIQKAYDEASAARRKQNSKDAQEAFKGYLQRAAAIEKETAALEKMEKTLGKSMGNVGQANAKSLEAMTRYIQGVNGLENAQVRATGAIQNSYGAFQTYQATVANADGTTQRFRVSANTATGEVYTLDQGIRSASSGANIFSTSISHMGKSLVNQTKSLIGFYGVVQSLRYAFREMKSMSDEMIVYQKVTKASAEEMEEIRKQSYESAKKYGQTPTDFLSAAQEMARAGYRENASAMADLAVKTKLVGDITAEEASKFLLAVDAGYKYQGNVEQLSEVLDMANEVGNNFATSIEKISGGMTLVASLSGQVGVPIEELIAALGTMTAVTQRSGEESARALRSVFLNILKDTTSEIEEGVTVTEDQMSALDKVIEEFGDDSMKAARAAGQLINPLSVIGKLSEAYKSGFIKNQAELFTILKDVGGQRYYNALAALIENYDTMYQDMLETEKNAAGSAQKEIDVLTQAWSQKLNTLKTTWIEMVDSSITEGFIKQLIDGATAALNFAGSLENLALMAVGAKVAIKSASSAFKQFSTIQKMLENGQKIGGLQTAGAGLSAGLAVLGTAVSIAGIIKAAREQYIRELEQAAQEAATSAQKEIEKSTSLEGIIAKYEAVWADGTIEESELDTLKTLQNELNGLLGEQAGAIDLVNGKYDEMIGKLQNAQNEQANLTKAAIDEAYQRAYIAFSQKNLTTIFDEINGMFHKDTDSYDAFTQAIEAIGGSEYVKFIDMASVPKLQINKPDSIEGMFEFYEEVMSLSEQLATYRNEEGKTLSELDSKQYGLILRIKDSLAESIGAATELKKLEEQRQTKNASTPLAAATAPDSASVEIVKNSALAWDALTASINKATIAKIAFDTAMKTTKADAMNDYMSAWETLQGEIKAGRVNSTAFYAAAKMLIGDEMYNRLGGSSMGIRNYMGTRRGESGSMMDALDILFAQYEDKNGNIIEGYGVYELLRQTKKIDQSQLKSKDGQLLIPAFSDADLRMISEQWGGISTDILTALFNALDQYDKDGKATADVQDALQSGEEAAADALQEMTDAAKEAAKALQELQSDRVKDLKEGTWNGTTSTGADLTGTQLWRNYQNYLISEQVNPGALQNNIYQSGMDIVMAFIEAQGNATDALNRLGMNWNDISERFFGDGGRYAGMGTGGKSISNWLSEYISNLIDNRFTIQIDADTDDAMKVVDNTISKINKKTAKIDVDADVKTSASSSEGGFLSKILNSLHLASGTRSFGGGTALVNDGAGPELIVDNGSAYIAGGGKPAFVSLGRGAQVFNATQTKAIFNRSGVPAFASGNVLTGLFDAVRNVLNLDEEATRVKDEEEEKEEEKKKTSGGGSAAATPANAKEAYDKLKTLIDYILNRIQRALSDQLEIIDGQIEALEKEREQQQQQNELEEKQQAVAEAQKNLQDALNERTVRYLGDDGKWHWMADARNVQSAREALDNAEKDLREYQEEQLFNERVAALEAQKQALQDEYDQISQTWEDIQTAVSTPTDDLQGLLADILKNGTDTEKKAADFIQKLLIASLLQGGSYTRNYDEALSSVSLAAAGNPVMPGEASETLASLIAMSGAGMGGSALSGALVGASGVLPQSGDVGSVYSSPIANYNYFINGMSLGADQANRPLSEIMRSLTVYANSQVY